MVGEVIVIWKLASDAGIAESFSFPQIVLGFSSLFGLSTWLLGLPHNMAGRFQKAMEAAIPSEGWAQN